jgi:lipopolysaccharide export system protein LptA
MRADKMVAYTDATNHIERVEARGNSHLKQTDKAEIQSPDMDFFFGASHQLERALAVGGASMRSLDGAAPREARATTIEAFFTPGEHGSLVNSVHAEGDTVVQVHAPKPANDHDNPTERQLTANHVTLQFYPDGKNISAADASENAVMIVTPIRAVKGADKKTLRAPQMNGVFYETDNRLKTFTATGGVKVEIESLIANAHPLRTTTSRQLVADFLPDTQDIDRVTQEGDFKYNEGDRNGVAERAIYDGQKEILNLRGKRPQTWDAKGRTQADEIDYDRQNDESHARGDVRTTYYSRESANNSTPFSNTKSPVFITAERADARNGDGVAVYTVNARGWQDDNFVKADRIELYQDDKRMVAIGHVESALYQVKKNAAAPDGQSQTVSAADTSDGQSQPSTAAVKPDAADGQSQPPGDKDKKQGRRKSARSQENAPGFATADRMTYADKERLIHYEGNVKARQGDDHIEAAKVDVYLQPETNEVDHLNAETNVILTQPGRRGTGDHLAYTSSDGRAVLTGKSARVEDAEKGSTMGTQLTFYSRDDKITVANQQGAGRVRSTHRLTKSKAN